MKEVKDALKILIQGESEAVELYSAFSEVAIKESYSNIALLFKALSMAEKIHIKNHYNALDEEFIPNKLENIEVSSTVDNLKSAITGEIEESKNLYPRLIKSIKKYTNKEYGKVARLSMNWAKNVEKEHAKLLKLALKSIEAGKDMDFEKLSICQVCGNLVVDDVAEKECRICGHDTIFFKAVPREFV